MATAEIKNIKNEKVGDIDLQDALFNVELKESIIHDIVRMQLANRRSGNACTKTRKEIRGSSAKPWRQKGTGKARAGTRKSPLWRGGGTTFGPKPRDYSYSLPKKVCNLGLRMAISSRFQDNLIIILDGFELAAIKTKDFAKIMETLNIKNGLIVTHQPNEALEKSSKNINDFKVLPTVGLNVYDILKYEHLILLQPTIGQLEERLLS